MKLYYSTGACSLSPHIVARELGIDLELERVDFATKRTDAGQDYLKVNPKGYVPALVLDNGEVLTEGPAIVQYLADLRPEAGLAPDSKSFARYRLQEWLNFISTELHKSFSPLFNAKTPEEFRAQVVERLATRIGYVASRLAGRQYLMGDEFTVADAYLYTVLSWARLVKLDLSPWPVVTQYLERVHARPAVQEARRVEKERTRSAT